MTVPVCAARCNARAQRWEWQRAHDQLGRRRFAGCAAAPGPSSLRAPAPGGRCGAAAWAAVDGCESWGSATSAMCMSAADGSCAPAPLPLPTASWAAPARPGPCLRCAGCLSVTPGRAAAPIHRPQAQQNLRREPAPGALPRHSAALRAPAAAMEAPEGAVKQVKDFAKGSYRLVKRCTKPDKKGASRRTEIRHDSRLGPAGRCGGASASCGPAPAPAIGWPQASGPPAAQAAVPAGLQQDRSLIRGRGCPWCCARSQRGGVRAPRPGAVARRAAAAAAEPAPR